jgi:hypothetical protein
VRTLLRDTQPNAYANGNGNGYGYGHGLGYGFGEGEGYGNCNGSGYGDGYDNGNGKGDGLGHGNGRTHYLSRFITDTILSTQDGVITTLSGDFPTVDELNLLKLL